MEWKIAHVLTSNLLLHQTYIQICWRAIQKCRNMTLYAYSNSNYRKMVLMFSRLNLQIEDAHRLRNDSHVLRITFEHSTVGNIKKFSVQFVRRTPKVNKKTVRPVFFC